MPQSASLQLERLTPTPLLVRRIERSTDLHGNGSEALDVRGTLDAGIYDVDVSTDGLSHAGDGAATSNGTIQMTFTIGPGT